ncbi:hypothetical protein SAMN05443246_2777 [Paenibacillus sp. GP183]|nr:hypothetical protein SAMN05443246_2777 [Paenibacillus sp. GP183]
MNNNIKWLLSIVSGALLILLIFTIIVLKPSKLTSTEPISTASPSVPKTTDEIRTTPSSMPSKVSKEKSDILNSFSKARYFS